MFVSIRGLLCWFKQSGVIQAMALADLALFVSVMRVLCWSMQAELVPACPNWADFLFLCKLVQVLPQAGLNLGLSRLD